MIIVALNVGSVGKLDPAFRTRRDEVRQLPDEVGEPEMRSGGGDRHAAKRGLTGLEFALELKRRQHFGAPAGMRVGPGGQDQPGLGADPGRFGPTELAEPLPRVWREQRFDFMQVEIEAAFRSRLARDSVNSG